MIKHIVMFKLKDSSPEKAEAARKKAMELLPNVPSIKKIEVKTNSKEAPESNFDIAIICDFEDIKGLNEYQVHPEHKKFGAYITPQREETGRACIDYEY
ncbi:MAG: Dabb family protein [Ruminococcus sp.]|nr:Dabb family protein [Ruminococcus sp.]